jgi:hypothetical protein
MRISNRTIALIFISMSIVSQSVASEGRGTYVAYLRKPMEGSLNVAFVVTDLRGKNLRDELAGSLKALCSRVPNLSMYRISIFADEKSANLAKKNIGTVPNLNSPEYQAIEQARLAMYSPDDGILQFANSEGPNARVSMGTKWCSS